MNRISEGRQKQSDFQRYRQNILLAVFLMTILVVPLLMVPVKVAATDEASGQTWQYLGQETGGYWQLLTPPEVDPVPEERISVDYLGGPDMGHAYAEEVRSGVLCKTVTNTLSDGSYTLNIKVNEGEKCYKNSGSFSAVATWGRPPERIIPGTPLALEANLSKSMQGPHGAYVSFGITTDEPDVVCGILTAGEKEVCINTVGSNDSSDKKADCVLEVGAGSSEGDQFALRYCIGQSGYRYVYEWVPVEEKPADPGPGVVEEPSPEQSEPEQPEPDVESPDVSPPDSDYDWPSSSASDYGSSESGGSWLGPLAVLGGLTGVAVMGGLAVLGGAGAIAIGIKVLGGGGGAAAASMTAGNPDVGVEVAEQVADVVEHTEENLDLKDKPSEMTREHLENEIQKELERLAEEGHYIGNKTAIKKLWNLSPTYWVGDWVTGNTQNYCEEAKELGRAHLEKILPKGTIIDHVALQRNTMMNHIANRVILPDGTELVIDYWEGLANNKPAVYTVKEWKEKWKKELGEPMHGRYEIDDVVSEGQKLMFDHVIKNGYDKIDEFSTKTLTSEEVETIKNWARREDWESLETWHNVRNSMTHENWENWKDLYLYKKRPPR